MKKDLIEARRWTERAAEGGDPKAMHNLGISYISGAGGPKNSTTAAQWFRRAADLGLVDSQYNLAALYEQGLGSARTRRSPTSGIWSPLARATARPAPALSGWPPASRPTPAPWPSARPRRSAPTRPTLDRPGHRPGGRPGLTDGRHRPARAVPARLLSGPHRRQRLGRLKLAVAAYQRDQGMQATGTLDPPTVSKLSVFTR
uniref:SEL1-like repeat protein n=1 Tax=Phenylobacterium glaciei TaxID=2803784 RepID=A0A974P5H5_9CAUL|nr:SEL1-like repeat protein [Phenylobacterium glaciei]